MLSKLSSRKKMNRLTYYLQENSVYGYLAIKGGFKLKKFWNSYSINSKANIGPNDGKKFSSKRKNINKSFRPKKINTKKN